MPLERLSIELTNRCGKACWFCYAHSTPAGDSRWTVNELVSFVRDCAQHGLQAVSFGGGEPLEFEGLFDVLAELRGVLFRSFTTNGLLLDEAMLARIDEARPNKVHVSIHFPSDTERVIRAVRSLEARGIRSGVNLLVPRSQLADATASARPCAKQASATIAWSTCPCAARTRQHRTNSDAWPGASTSSR